MAMPNKPLKGTPEFQALKACHMNLIYTIPTDDVLHQLFEKGVIPVDLLVGQGVAVPFERAKNEKLLLQIYSGTLGDFYTFLSVLCSKNCVNKQPSIRLKEELLKRGIDVEKSRTDPYKEMRVEPSEVYVWGSKRNLLLAADEKNPLEPNKSKLLENLDPSDIACGYDSLFVVSRNGGIFACGKGHMGCLGLGNCDDVNVPRQIPQLLPVMVTTVAIHPGGRHAMALTAEGKVYSWGCGDRGQLGHGNTLGYLDPTLIDELKSKEVTKIACGAMHSIAVLSDGKIFSWGDGSNGALGHGNNLAQLLPKKIMSLNGKHIMAVACGECYTIAVAGDDVWSWGLGGNGELGYGVEMPSYYMPTKIEALFFKGITNVACGYATSFAVSANGKVWAWGSGDRFRLGLGNEKVIVKPRQIQGDLKGKKIKRVVASLFHALAIDENGQVYIWGSQEIGPVGNDEDAVNKQPKSFNLVNKKMSNIACGNEISIAWT
ncbi:putative E3 ubiquitin-protein ligase HERC2 [Trichoplax sp. H2]|nr:putative E3 ubiquitin-protein ligase HERC2 [Trichoplax sp. H2]|eukprot:RDD36953.1 putative E3 ubiquitin-protein ligase HERC2 [Trichoplax sp. H2]